MHRRHRLGDRALLHRLRPAGQRRDGADVRGRAGLARAGPVLGDHRAVRGHDLLHRAHRDPRLHEVGHEHPAKPRPVEPAPARQVGEPINPEAWMWYHDDIGGGRCPIVDTWWQTETGGIMITPAARRHHHQARLRHAAVSRHRGRGGGRQAASRCADGRRVPDASSSRGRRCCARSTATTSAIVRPTGAASRAATSPATARKLDEDGYCWILGRVDDVLNVAGHRIGTMEVESALVDHPAVAEAAVVGQGPRAQGPGARGFVTLKDGHQASPGSSRTSSRRT